MTHHDPRDVVDGHLRSIENLPLGRDRGSSNYEETREIAAEAIRQEVGFQARDLRVARTEQSALKIRLADGKYMSRFTQQLARLLDIEVGHDSGADPNSRCYSVSGDGLDASVNCYFPHIVIGNAAEGLEPTELSLCSTGLTAATARQIAGMYGVRLTRGNTPKVIHTDLFGAEPDIPEAVGDIARMLGAKTVIEIGSLGAVFAR